MNGNAHEETGLKIGLEIHMQLSTQRKLFCDCQPSLEEEVEHSLIRRLRPTQSELGQIDPAALFEFQRGTLIKYLVPKRSCCLVEMDEEPPHPLNMEALKTALRVARALNSTIVDEIHVMRKIVIDGSNTMGFQRTCVVALGGSIKVEGREVPIQTLCLEEDAARIIEKVEGLSTYDLDRLGIPLIEIATAPVISSSEEAVEVALEIGRLTKASGYVRNELGVIRQDVNISVAGGRIVEVKGVQRLSQLRRVAEFEERRQRSLIEVAEELRNRGVKPQDLTFTPVDVTEIFRETGSSLIKGLMGEGVGVYALRLPGFAGLLGRETAPGHRLGREMAERVKFWTSARGLFHTDEMPAYGIGGEEVKLMMKALGASEVDAAVFIVEMEDEAHKALKKVLERALEALEGVPYETRGSKEDGSTFYMRPRPGMARMYPETDIPPIVVDPKLMGEVDAEPIPNPRERVEELVELGLSQQLGWEVYDSRYYNLFLDLAKRMTRVKPSFLASTLTETTKNLEKEGYDVSSLSEEKLREVFQVVEEGRTAKESIPELMKFLSKNRDKGVVQALETLKLEMLGRERLEEIIDEVISLNRDLIKEGKRGLGKMIGLVMSRVRGRADPKVVSEIVRDKIKI
ncbi:MAG: Glu-tRNA(Gln) amidotransferase subunit GatE [Candidatus Geothermarchaeales archaeon]